MVGRAGLTHGSEVHRGEGIRRGHDVLTLVPALGAAVRGQQETRRRFVLALGTTVLRVTKTVLRESLDAVTAMTRGIGDASLDQ